MKETFNQEKDKLENVKQFSIERKTVLIGKLKPKKGHTLFVFNHELMTIEKAKFDATPLLQWNDAVKGNISSKNKVTIKKDCIYISAMNKQNVIKILKRDYNFKI